MTYPSSAMTSPSAEGRSAPDARVSRELLETVSLYLHIPFCHAKCHYCDFNSYAGMLGLREEYVAALRDEILLAGQRARLAGGQPRRCRTVFFGGGTPSLLTAGQISELLAATRAAFALDAGAEVTMEANPGALEYSQLDAVRAAGVNRLSMGAQSFDPALLRWMGRIHSPEEIETAFQAACAAGFTNISLDFIFALPGQTQAVWMDTLERAIALGPDHLSLYNLIVEEGTPLFTWVQRGTAREVDEDTAADMYEAAQDRLARAGYLQYEISNWARPGHACAHNLTYWRNLPWIGLGAGGASFYAGQRFSETRPIRAYIARVREAVGAGETSERDGETLPAAAIVEREEISRELEMAETAMLGLRLNEGVSLDVFAARYGADFWETFGERLAEFRALGLIEETAGRARLTARGRMVGNEIFARLLPDK
ncbi:MAG TPA: radical SAM family heme chaperone HemW [Ktedonobacterales bacterium]|nr:radical SAM family heme chaperone HemW [Ktedonobacterales bacterium]